jgi:hypothetical protein
VMEAMFVEENGFGDFFFFGVKGLGIFENESYSKVISMSVLCVSTRQKTRWEKRAVSGKSYIIPGRRGSRAFTTVIN